jgi:hypothetical protein
MGGRSESAQVAVLVGGGPLRGRGATPSANRRLSPRALTLVRRSLARSGVRAGAVLLSTAARPEP